MTILKVGTRVKLKPSVGSYATHGYVRDVWASEYEGVSPLYTVETVDQEGYCKTEYLRRDQFTIPRAGAR